MENTPLGRAYDSAKNAIVYRDTGSLNAARESHEQAAGNFATAADETDDFEAVRLLSLLQEHHKQLAKALSSSKSLKSTPQSTPEKEKDSVVEAPKAEVVPSSQDDSKSTAHSTKTNPALATLSLRRQPRRDLTSSIASNLATARGKPSSARRAEPLPPNVTAQHAGGKIVSRASERLSASQRSSRPAPVVQLVSEQPSADDGFTRFYNTLHGLYSKLPGSLAFTGLPMTPEEDNEAQTATSKDTMVHKRKPSSRATAEPEYSTIFSPATIRAVNKEAGNAIAPHESFYVVPPSGGTRSYAGIVSGRDDDPDDLLADEEGDEFVDARENLGPPSPKASRTSQTLRKGKKPVEAKSATGKTMEELDLENNALRQLVDTQSRRLQMWEASAQSQSMALAQSMRLNRKATSPETSPPKPESERVKKLEEDLYAERAQREVVEHQYEKMERENEKLLLQVSNLRKYKERWERLKETARQKQRDREAKGDGVDAIRLA